MIELGINIEENTNFDEQKQSTTIEQTSDTANEAIEINQMNCIDNKNRLIIY